MAKEDSLAKEELVSVNDNFDVDQNSQETNETKKAPNENKEDTLDWINDEEK